MFVSRLLYLFCDKNLVNNQSVLSSFWYSSNCPLWYFSNWFLIILVWILHARSGYEILLQLLLSSLSLFHSSCIFYSSHIHSIFLSLMLHQRVSKFTVLSCFVRYSYHLSLTVSLLHVLFWVYVFTIPFPSAFPSFSSSIKHLILFSSSALFFNTSTTTSTTTSTSR